MLVIMQKNMDYGYDTITNSKINIKSLLFVPWNKKIAFEEMIEYNKFISRG